MLLWIHLPLIVFNLRTAVDKSQSFPSIYFNRRFIAVSYQPGLYTERKKKRRVNFIPKFHSSLKKFVKYFTMITKRYMYGTKVQNFIGL